jgi:pimeloyl-ACP methyl ester carboxylesterase
MDCTKLTRRRILQGIGAAVAHSALTSHAAAAAGENRSVEYGQGTLPPGIRSRRVDNNNGVTLHLLEAGFETPGRPCVVLLHGFPELAYTWRKQLLPLAQAGFHVIAPDLRGYGRSVTTPVAFHDDLLPYSMLNRVTDVLGLVRALGYEKVAAVVGHDWGSPTAAWCGLVRPDVFQSVVLMSTPFAGTPSLPLDTANRSREAVSGAGIDRQLAALPKPRKHYLTYSASPGANDDMWRAPQGVHDLLRALYHFKSADWPGNKPFALKSGAPSELARMPAYYIMDLDKGIAETMATAMPSKAEIAACRWLTEQELRVYSSEYVRTGFQGGLNSYRIFADAKYSARGFAGRTIDVPSCFIGGASEWGVYQSPGAFEEMQRGACTRLLGVHLIAGAGHSLGEEQPEKVNRVLLEFLGRVRSNS